MFFVVFLSIVAALLQTAEVLQKFEQLFPKPRGQY